MFGNSLALATSALILSAIQAPALAQDVAYKDIAVGTGPVATAGSRLVVHYVGSFEDGRVFDQSTDRSPFSFPLGAGRVIKGWDIGLNGMRAGGIRKLKIPSNLAYGSKGAGSVIPPNTPLTFDVLLMSVNGVTGSQANTQRGTPRGPKPNLGRTLSDTPFYW